MSQSHHTAADGAGSVLGLGSRTANMVFICGILGPIWMFVLLLSCGRFFSVVPLAPEVFLGLCLLLYVTLVYKSSGNSGVKLLKAASVVISAESIVHLPAPFINLGFAWIPVCSLVLCFAGLSVSQISIGRLFLWCGVIGIVMLLEGILSVVYICKTNGFEGVF